MSNKQLFLAAKNKDGYGVAIEKEVHPPTMSSIGDHETYDQDERNYKKALSSGILVHPSYLENHKVGWMNDDWEEGYEYNSKDKGWISATKDACDLCPKEHCRKVIVPKVADWGIGDKFTTAETDDTIFIVKEVSECDVIAYDNRSRSGETHFAKWYIQKVIPRSSNVEGSGEKYVYQDSERRRNISSTHPTQGEDKREEGKLTAVEILEKHSPLYFYPREKSGIVAAMQEYAHQFTTPPNKEGERGEKEALEMAKDAAVSYCYKGVWPIESHPKVQNDNRGMYTHFKAGFTAALSTRGKDAVEEWIICAANHYDDDTVHNHQPINVKKGFVTTGRRHHNCIGTFAQIAGFPYSEYWQDIHNTEEQGFLTNLNRFVDRKEAFEIASVAGQIIGPNKGQSENSIGLTSEDLY